MDQGNQKLRLPSPADRLEQIIAVCDRFEAVWLAGQQPNIEDYLSGDQSSRRAVLVELLRIDLEYRIKSGISLPLESYITRFPELAEGEETASQTPLLSPAPAGSLSWGGDAGYELLAEIGRGGMGVVYKARHRGLHRLVALKLIRDGACARPDLLGRLRTEAKALASLYHENIVQVYDIGEMNGDPFVALEFLQGGTLAAKLAGTPQPDRMAAEMSRTLARAIHAAHLVGVIHRDLKPLNVLLDGSGRLKIADFGLASVSKSSRGKPSPARSSGRPPTWPPSRLAGMPTKSDRLPTCTR